VGFPGRLFGRELKDETDSNEFAGAGSDAAGPED
jgi:hypothetical protein